MCSSLLSLKTLVGIENLNLGRAGIAWWCRATALALGKQQVDISELLESQVIKSLAEC